MQSERLAYFVLLLHHKVGILVHAGKRALREKNKLALSELVVVVLLQNSGNRVSVELRGHDVDGDVHQSMEELPDRVLDLSHGQKDTLEKCLVYKNDRHKAEPTRRKAKVAVSFGNRRVEKGRLQ